MFNIGDIVEDTELGGLGEGVVTEIMFDKYYPVIVSYPNAKDISYTLDGRRWSDDEVVLRLVKAKEFKVGDKVYHPDYGKGSVVNVSEYKIYVHFMPTDWHEDFLLDGRMLESGEITLRHLENENESK